MNRISINLVCAVLAACGLLYGCSSAPNTANNSKPATNGNTSTAPKAQQTIPPDAPPGAQPPEQMGSASASVTLEEFADMQCPSCAAAHPTMNEIKSMYGSRIHFIFRNFPLQIPAHDKSYEGALAASAAGMQNKFWDMQNMLFSNQKTWSSDPTYKDIWKGYAQKIGLDVKKWETDMSGMAAKARVDADVARGKAVGINSTPTLFINGTSIPFSDMTVGSLKSLIDAELQKTSGGSTSNTNTAPPPAAGNTNK
jgi:protein-disulfide isomerase